MSFPDNDYLLLRDEPGYHGGEPTDDEDDAGGLDAKGWADLRHAVRGVGYVRASFRITDGRVEEVQL